MVLRQEQAARRSGVEPTLDTRFLIPAQHVGGTLPPDCTYPRHGNSVVYTVEHDSAALAPRGASATTAINDATTSNAGASERRPLFPAEAIDPKLWNKIAASLDG
jgi:hypothetical protein